MVELHLHEELPEPGAEVQAALAQLLGDPSLGFVLLAEADGAVVGHLVVGYGFSLEFHGRDAFVDELFVEVAWRGSGLGGRMLAHAEALCRAAGIHALHLEVAHGNRARGLYLRSGYRDHERHLMTKRLS